MALLTRIARRTWTPPFSEPLASNVEEYIQRCAPVSVAWRYIRRKISLLLTGQHARERPTPLPQGLRILWIYKGTPQIGDAMMDLACRVLLKGHVKQVDLYTDPHLAALFKDDDVFGQTFSSAKEIDLTQYDCAIVHSYSSHCLKDKVRHFKKLPFVPFYGFYTGPELNRTQFGFFRMAQIIGQNLNADAKMTPHLRIQDAHRAALAAYPLPDRYICLVIGGVREDRTYAHWDQVISQLRQSQPDLPVVLVGSENGLAMRDRIVALGLPDIIDLTTRISLHEIAALFEKSQLNICADGGLMHIAAATDTPMLALLAHYIRPDLRFCPQQPATVLYSAGAVSEITPAQLAATLLQQLTASRPDLQIIESR